MQTCHLMGTSQNLLEQCRRKLVMVALGCWQRKGGFTFSGLMRGKSSGLIQKLNSKEKEKEGRKILSLQSLGSGRMYGIDLMKIMLKMHNLGGNQ